MTFLPTITPRMERIQVNLGDGIFLVDSPQLRNKAAEYLSLFNATQKSYSQIRLMGIDKIITL